MPPRSRLAAACLFALPVACGDEVDGLSDIGGSADAGVLADAGASPADAGTGPADGGAGPTDAGSGPSDGGSPADAGGADGGLAISAPARTWTWVDVPDSRCMNGTPTGFGVNLVPGATRAVVFLQGGNACFNQASCAITANTDGYGRSKFESEIAGLAGRSAFDRDAADNPFADASYVYVPYCTGDVHAGNNPSGRVGNQSYQFVGFRNMELYLDRVVPTLRGVTEVALVGVSAGGFGAALDFDLVQSRFGSDVRVTLIDDSGPPMGSDFLSACLQSHFRTLWNLDEGALASCPSCDVDPNGAFVEDFLAFILFTYSDRNFAFLSHDGDQVIRGFWGYGANDCAGLNNFLPPPYSAERFRMGLADLRNRILGGVDSGKTWIIPGGGHVLLTTAPWEQSQGGQTLAEWIGQALADDPAWDHNPAN